MRFRFGTASCGGIGSDQCLGAAVGVRTRRLQLCEKEAASRLQKSGSLMDWLSTWIACIAFAAQFFCAGVLVGMKWQERTKN